MRKQLIGALVLTAALSFPSAARADGGPTISLNGKNLEVPSGIVDNRALVGVRGVLEAMGAKVTWLADQQIVVATLNGTIIELPIGSNTAKINSRTVTLDVPARIDNNRTMVPVRFMAEGLGARVGYDAASRTVVISTPGGGSGGSGVAPVSRGDSSRDTARLQAKLVQVANSLVGSPYVYGGTSPAGFDCSGFAAYIFRQIAVDLPRTAAEQFSRGYKVTMDQLQPGDLMFWDTEDDGSASHVGVYVGNGNFVHAENANKGVVTTSVYRAWWVPRYLGARRILP